MDFKSVGITATASYLPNNIVTNQQIVDRGVDTSDEWIREHIGIEERREVSNGWKCPLSRQGRCVDY